MPRPGCSTTTSPSCWPPDPRRLPTDAELEVEDGHEVVASSGSQVVASAQSQSTSTPRSAARRRPWSRPTSEKSTRTPRCDIGRSTRAHPSGPPWGPPRRDRRIDGSRPAVAGPQRPGSGPKFVRGRPGRAATASQDPLEVAEQDAGGIEPVRHRTDQRGAAGTAGPPGQVWPPPSMRCSTMGTPAGPCQVRRTTPEVAGPGEASRSTSGRGSQPAIAGPVGGQRLGAHAHAPTAVGSAPGQPRPGRPGAVRRPARRRAPGAGLATGRRRRGPGDRRRRGTSSPAWDPAGVGDVAGAPTRAVPATRPMPATPIGRHPGQVVAHERAVGHAAHEHGVGVGHPRGGQVVDQATRKPASSTSAPPGQPGAGAPVVPGPVQPVGEDGGEAGAGARAGPGRSARPCRGPGRRRRAARSPAGRGWPGDGAHQEGALLAVDVDRQQGSPSAAWRRRARGPSPGVPQACPASAGRCRARLPSSRSSMVRSPMRWLTTASMTGQM